MCALLLKKPAVFQFEDENSGLLHSTPKKTGKDETYSYAAGERRLRIELDDRPPNVVEGYIKKYRDLCDSIYYALIDAGVASKDEKKFAIEFCSVLYSNMNMKHKSTDSLYQFLDTLGSENPELDCDISAFLAFDIGSRLGIKGLEIVSVPDHVFIRTAHWAIETTEGSPGDCVFPISKLNERYPVIFFSSGDLDKIHCISFMVRGAAKYDLKDYKGAIADYDEAIRLNSKYADAIYNRGLAKKKLGDFKDAIDDYTKAIELNPKEAEAYYSRGNANDDLGDFKGAIADHDEAIKLNSKYANAYYNRALARRKLGDEEGHDADMEMYEKLEKEQKK